MSKLVEQVVFKQLMQYINSDNLDNPHQSAYKTDHFTETALLHIKNEISLSLSHGDPTALVLHDLLTAFNTIVHDTLLNYLMSWFCVFSTALLLQTPIPKINTGSTLSELYQRLFGVPQGSLLGPLHK